MNGIPHNYTMSIQVSSVGRTLSLIIVESILFFTLDVTSFIGNLLVCIAVYKYQSLRVITNLFIFSLALTDLLTAILVLPFGMISSFADRWVFKDTGCQIYRFTGYYLVGVSLSVLTIIAVERYTKLSKPGLHRKVFSKKRTLVINLTIWSSTGVLVAVVFPLVGVKFQLSTNNPTLCLTVFDNKVASLLFNSIHTAYFLLPSIVIAWCYKNIYQIICQHNATVVPALQSVTPSTNLTSQQQDSSPQDSTSSDPNHICATSLPVGFLVIGKVLYLPRERSPYAISSSQERDSRHEIEEKKLLKMLAVVLAGFCICWMPGFVFGITEMVKPIGNDALQYLNLYYYFPAYTSSMINPIIYATMNQRFRVAFKKILFCR